MTNAPMWLLIAEAYHVHRDLITGGPGWLDTDRFDVIAKSKPDAAEGDLRRRVTSPCLWSTKPASRAAMN